MSNYYVDSFAYDFDMFAPQPKQKSNVVEIQRKKSTPSDNRSSRSPRRSASRKAPLVMMLILVPTFMSVPKLQFSVYLTSVPS